MSQGYSGYQGNVLAGANDVDCQDWSADHEVNTWDSTTTADAGWDDTSTATKKLSGTFDILYDPTKTPFGTLGLTPGSTVSLQLFVNKPAGIALAGSALLTKASIKSATKDGIKVAISFVNKGPWTLPS
jgi:hypothetical protein